MGLLKITQFGGEVPVKGVRSLPDGFAVQSVNTWLYSDELAAIRPNIPLRDLLSTTRKVFRIPRGTLGGDPNFPTSVPPPSYLGDSTWLEFSDPDTDIVRGPLVNDSFKRWYFCSPSTGLQVNTYSRLVLGEPPYDAGVANPSSTLGITVVGGVGAVVTRGYLYTFVNIWGEEGGPSPPVTAAGAADGSWNVTGIVDPTVGETGDRVAIDHKVLYRTITAASGTTTFFKVAEIPLGTTTYSDTSLDTVVAGNLSYENANGNLAPPNLQGIIAMPNGFFIGWVDSDLYFSEPYRPYSWPVEYIVSTEYPVVGLGVFGQTCAIMTQGYPAAVQGITPATTALSKTTVMEPCLSRAGIVTTPEGVYYPSPNGLVSITPNGVNNITQQLITKEEWGRDFQPQFLRACRYQQGYLALRAIPDPDMPLRTAFYFDLSDLRTAVTELSEFANARMVQGDVWSGEVFTIKNAKLYHHDPPSDSYLPLLWMSKEYQYLYKENFSCYALFWDEDRADLASTDAPSIIPVGIPAHIRVWADRRLVYDQHVPVNSEAVRLPSGFKATVWQFEISSRAPVFAFHVASTIKELRGA